MGAPGRGGWRGDRGAAMEAVAAAVLAMGEPVGAAAAAAGLPRG